MTECIFLPHTRPYFRTHTLFLSLVMKRKPSPCSREDYFVVKYPVLSRECVVYITTLFALLLPFTVINNLVFLSLTTTLALILNPYCQWEAFHCCHLFYCFCFFLLWYFIRNVVVCVFCVTFTLSIQLVNDKHLDYILVHVCMYVCVTENLHHSLVSVLPSKSVSRYGYKLLCFVFIFSFPFLCMRDCLQMKVNSWEKVNVWVCVCVQFE